MKLSLGSPEVVIAILQQEQVARTFHAEGPAEESLSSALMRDSAKEVFAAVAVSRSCSLPIA
jgi:hypothetical protein